MNSLKRIMVLLCLIFISTYQISAKLVVKVTEEQFGELLKDDDVVVLLVNAKLPTPIAFGAASVLGVSSSGMGAPAPQGRRLARGARRVGRGGTPFGAQSTSVPTFGAGVPGSIPFGVQPRVEEPEEHEAPKEEALEYTCFIERGGFYFYTITTNLIWNKHVNLIPGKSIANSSTINLTASE